MNYYNENDPKAAAWLRELIKEGHISEGVVDERSIVDVQPAELVGYRQCHFFAGIGGWSYALRLAGVPDDELIWTGSCPCQPFSNAGLQLGTADARHLWPIFFNLIRECGPPTVFGEQVASKAGRDWLAGVFADLEGVAYAAAGADLCAAGVGSPHIRQRLYWLANPRHHDGGRWSFSDKKKWAAATNSSRLGEPYDERLEGAHCNGETPRRIQLEPTNTSRGTPCGVEHPNSAPQERLRPIGLPVEPKQETRRPSNAAPWEKSSLVRCADGKTRRIESGTSPLAHGIPGRVGLLRGYGNAIVPQVAAEFIQAFYDVRSDVLTFSPKKLLTESARVDRTENLETENH